MLFIQQEVITCTQGRSRWKSLDEQCLEWPLVGLVVSFCGSAWEALVVLLCGSLCGGSSSIICVSAWDALYVAGCAWDALS